MKNQTQRGGLKAPMSRRLLHLALVASVLTACGDTPDAAPPVTTAPPANTVAGVGRLPTTIPAVTFPADVAEGVVLPAIDGVVIGEEVQGNRVLMIGDSIFAGLSRRHSNTACDQLVPLGWQVAVEAESGRFAEFGERVARRRAAEGWDVVVVFLGSNYDGFEQRYERELVATLDRFEGVPTVLVTTTLFRSMQREVNQVVRTVADERLGARVIEWETISRSSGLLSADGLHPSADGQVVLTAAVAQVLGAAPDGDARCLDSLFTDDSVNPDGPQSGGRSTSTTSALSTTTKSATSTTIPDSAPDDPGDVDDTTPDESVTDDSVTDDSVVDDTVPDATVPDDTVPDDTVPGDTVPDTTRPPDPTTIAPSPETTGAP